LKFKFFDYIKLRIIAIIDLGSGFTFGKYSNQLKQDALVSIPLFARMAGFSNIQNVNKIPIG